MGEPGGFGVEHQHAHNGARVVGNRTKVHAGHQPAQDPVVGVLLQQLGHLLQIQRHGCRNGRRGWGLRGLGRVKLETELGHL
ncbi:hypothetical protein FQZ97_1028960 [compost metagenome]